MTHIRPLDRTDEIQEGNPFRVLAETTRAPTATPQELQALSASVASVDWIGTFKAQARRAYPLDSDELARQRYRATNLGRAATVLGERLEQTLAQLGNCRRRNRELEAFRERVEALIDEGTISEEAARELMTERNREESA